jgi:putative FmdB family regulatory protein
LQSARCAPIYNQTIFIFLIFYPNAMPIYAYKCESCGHAKDVLQKMSDPALTDCPACGAAAFKKQLTAAGFQLKGSGWYATDFRGSTSGAGGTSAPASGPTDSAASSSAASSDAPAAPAGGCCGSCSCH